MRAWAAALGLALAALRAQASPRPLVAALSTCSALTPSTYPADTVSWFDPQRHPQVVFYAHLLFPLGPSDDRRAVQEAWHPPLRWDGEAAGVPGAVVDQFYAEADWIDPDGELVAAYGLTMPARVSSDILRLKDRSYIPHTFAMAIGTKDLRGSTGQKKLPEKEGQYTVRFYVDGRALGLAFFRMLRPGGAPPPAPAKPLPSPTPGA